MDCWPKMLSACRFLALLALLAAGCSRTGSRPVYPVPGEVTPIAGDTGDAAAAAEVAPPEVIVDLAPDLGPEFIPEVTEAGAGEVTLEILEVTPDIALDCGPIVIGPGGDELFDPGEENSGGVALDESGYLTLSSDDGFYRHVLDLEEWCPGGAWLSLAFDYLTEGEGTCYFKISLRSAEDTEQLIGTSWSGLFGPFPPEQTPIDLTAIWGVDQRFLELNLQIVAEGDCKPTVHSVTVVAGP